MRVMCRAVSLTSEQKREIGIPERENPNYSSWLAVGAIYMVLGVNCQVGYYAGTLLQLPGDYVHFVPLCLFNVVDGRPSRYWEARKFGDSCLMLWPAEFYADYFHDDLSN